MRPQLGSGQPTNLNTLVTRVEEVTGKKINLSHAPARAGEIKDTYCDISKAKTQLGFTADTALQDGLAATWNWFQQQSQTEQSKFLGLPEIGAEPTSLATGANRPL